MKSTTDNIEKLQHEDRLLVSTCCSSPDLIEPDYEMAEQMGSLARAFSCYICKACGEPCNVVEAEKKQITAADAAFSNVRLIANFMGWVNSPYENTPNKVYTPDLENGKPLNQFRYSESWDELMPVIEKIETLQSEKESGIQFQFNISSEGICISGFDDGSGIIALQKNEIGKSKLQAAFKVVVAFLEFYPSLKNTEV